MKKLFLLLSVFTLLVGCNETTTDDNEKQEEKVTIETVDFMGYEDLPSDHVYETLTLAEYEEMKNPDIYIFFGKSTWPFCVEAAPVLNELAKENDIDTIYYVDTSIESNFDFYKMFNIQVVPSVVKIEKGELVVNSADITKFDDVEDLEEYYSLVFEELFNY